MIKTIAKQSCTYIIDVLLSAVPRSIRKLILAGILKRDGAAAAKLAPRSRMREWKETTLPNGVDGFEDLAFLFTSAHENRGILRMDFDEAALLYGIVARIPARRGVEIGRFRGGSTVMLSAAMPDNGRLVSIDIQPKDDDAVRAALRHIGTDHKVALVVSDANDVDYDEELDFVFIDGGHSYEAAKKDHLKWGALVKKGGLIVHHDMAMGRPDALPHAALLRLQEDIVRHQGRDVELRKEAGSLAVFCRISDELHPF